QPGRSVHAESPGRRHHGRRRQPFRRPDRRAHLGPGRELRRRVRRSRPHACRHLRHLPAGAAGPPARHFRPEQPMSGREMLGIALAAVAVAVLAGVPLMLGDYGLSLAINIVSYTVLATAWSLFSGPTRYVSL